MIVGIDGTPAIRPLLTGTEVYARSMIQALARSRDERGVRVYANAVDAPPWLTPGVEWRGIPFPRLWTHWRLRQALRRERPDVSFIPSHVLPVGLNLPSVVTIHDIGHRHEPRAYSRFAWWYLELTTRYAARRATRLIAVSQSTADDLRRFYGVPGGRVAVIHSGIDTRMQPQAPPVVARLAERLGIDEPYFLYLGRNHPRKNLPMLRRAFIDARARGLRASLVLAGPGHDARLAGDGLIVLPQLQFQPPRPRAFTFFFLLTLRFDQLAKLLVEYSIRLQRNETGVLLSPDDAGAWSQAMLELASDPALQQRLIEAGAARSAGFTWEAAADKTWRVLVAAATRQPATSR